MRRLLLAAALVLAAAAPAFAGDEDKNAVGFFLLSVTLIPLALFPLGLAFLLLFRALAPRRTRQLVHTAETRPTLTLTLGFVNFVVLAVIFLAAQQRAQPIALFAWVLWTFLSGLGSYGVASSLGARILGSTVGPRAELRELALGWFVIAYVSCFPLVGWCFGLYWGFRGVGSLLVSVFAPDLPEPGAAP